MGAYILTRDVNSVSCYLIFRKRALPGISSWTENCVGVICFLLMTKAIPAVECGASGSAEEMIFNFT